MPDKPRNLLIIMSDDQGPWAMGCAGTPEIRTPNLDRLAAEGIRFSNFFCASPVCSPARASFLTGRIPSQHGVHDWLKSGNIAAEEGVTWCGRDRPIEYLHGMSGFTDVLAGGGYLCAFSGKWHLGFPDPEAERLPGRSFAAVLEGREGAGRDDVVVFDEYGPTRMIRERGWKYIHRYPYGPHELYCLAEDPGEERNLVDDPQCRDELTRLRGKLDAWFFRYADPALDGVRQPVSGHGQIDVAGPDNDGREAFAQG